MWGKRAYLLLKYVNKSRDCDVRLVYNMVLVKMLRFVNNLLRTHGKACDG